MNAPGTKETVIQVIDDLGAGGAERMLVGLLKELSGKFKIILVTLNDKSDFKDDEIICSHRYNLGFTGIRSLPSTVRKLKMIIAEHRPGLVASHLYWSTVVSRLACPRNIPLVFTVHQMLSEGAFNFNKKGIFLKWLDKFTYRKRHAMIGVSEEVIKDYNREIGVNGKTFVLHNYVLDKYFDPGASNIADAKSLRLVAVGNPKWEKNFEGLIRALAQMRQAAVHCDIFGYSSYNKGLQVLIDDSKAPVTLKGRSETIHEQLKNYDVFVMSSFSEGFGIAAAEAMASGLPLLVSDLPVLREITQGNAIYFDPRKEKDLEKRLQEIISGKYDLAAMSEKGRKIAKDNYTKQVYLQKLMGIYNEVFNERISAK